MSKRVWMSAAVFLWAAWLAWAEQSKEQKLVADLLKALAELSENRQRTFNSIVTASSSLHEVNGHSLATMHQPDHATEPLSDEIVRALNQLRRSNGHAAHH